MAINRTLITSQSVKDNTDIVIEMLPSRPLLSTAFTPARPAGQLCGYYNAVNGRVELYIVANSGIRFLRVT